MQRLKKIFANPVAVTIVTAHWLVFILAMLFERHLIFRESISMHVLEPVFFDFMLYLNTPSALIMESVIYPVLSLFGKNFITVSFDVLLFLIFSSLQWFGLSHLLISVVEIYQPKEVKLSLK